MQLAEYVQVCQRLHDFQITARHTFALQQIRYFPEELAAVLIAAVKPDWWRTIAKRANHGSGGLGRL